MKTLALQLQTRHGGTVTPSARLRAVRRPQSAWRSARWPPATTCTPGLSLLVFAPFALDGRWIATAAALYDVIAGQSRLRTCTPPPAMRSVDVSSVAARRSALHAIHVVAPVPRP